MSELEEDLPVDFPVEDLLPPDLEVVEEEVPDFEVALGVVEDLLLPEVEEEVAFLEEPEELPVVGDMEVPELPNPDPDPLSPMLLVVEPVMRCELIDPRLASEFELLPMLPDDEEEAFEPVLLLEPEVDPRLLFCCSF
ncbi:hypothetical protein [Rufibacter radiotolerans]|uniref:hypothetical protein n=1 Tax=Rufibacter radiotolerans TaxID=1379910 RepID=UPI0012E1E7AB|nr:hypothetical protein [Rufibacter radiotolerans]